MSVILNIFKYKYTNYTMSIPTLYKFPNETNEFQLPDFGTQELIAYLASLTFEDGTSVFMTGLRNIPVADIQLLSTYAKREQNETNETFIQRLGQMILFNRLSNRICEKCGDKHDIRKLSLCRDCGLSWYCSKECQEQHWSTHKLRCCKQDGPLDKGYQQMTFLEVDSK